MRVLDRFAAAGEVGLIAGAMSLAGVTLFLFGLLLLALLPLLVPIAFWFGREREVRAEVR
jgi:Zn-dependent protease with chaperone function